MKASLSATLLAGAAACGGPDGAVHLDVSRDPPELLSAYGFFAWDGAELSYHEDLAVYDLNSALFSDYALKSRAVYVPPDLAAQFRAEGPLELPVGSAIVKSFLFPPDLRSPAQDPVLVETRVLRHTPDGWEGLPYIWNSEGTDATLEIGGDVRSISFTDPDGVERQADYLIPQKNQCGACHEQLDDDDERYLTPIGITARNLHKDAPDGGGNQLQAWADRGLLEGLPALEDITPAFAFAELDVAQLATAETALIERAARDYLDVNCAHCHNDHAQAGQSSQLFLRWDATDAFHLGVCKLPGSAGSGAEGDYDVVPGSPETSILMYRLQTEEVGSMMPLIGRSVTHTDGAALVREWISRLTGTCP